MSDTQETSNIDIICVNIEDDAYGSIFIDEEGMTLVDYIATYGNSKQNVNDPTNHPDNVNADEWV